MRGDQVTRRELLEIPDRGRDAARRRSAQVEASEERMHAGYARLAHRFSERVDHTRMATPGQDDQPAPVEMGDDRAIIRGVIELPRTAGPIEHLSTRPPALVRRPARDHREEEESPREEHAGTFLKDRRRGRSGEELGIEPVTTSAKISPSPAALTEGGSMEDNGHGRSPSPTAGEREGFREPSVVVRVAVAQEDRVDPAQILSQIANVGPQHVAPEPTIEERRRLSVRVRDLDHERQSVRAQRRGLASRLEHIAEPSNRALAALDAAREVAGQRGQADPCDGLETEAHEGW